MIRCLVAGLVVMACGKSHEDAATPPPAPESVAPPVASAASTADAVLADAMAPALPSSIDGIPVRYRSASDYAPIVFDADHFYVADGPTGIVRVAKATGEVAQLASVGNYDVKLVTGGTLIACKRAGGGCIRVPVAGGKATELAPGVDVDQLAADDKAAYAVTDAKAVVRIPFATGDDEELSPPLADGSRRLIAATGGGALIAETGVAPDGSSTNVLVRYAHGGGQKLGKLPHRPLAVVGDGTTVYVLGWHGIDKVAVGGRVTELAAWDLADKALMVAGDKELYFTIAGDNTALYRLPKAGGKLEQLRDLPAYAQILSADATTLWLRVRDAILALPKP